LDASAWRSAEASVTSGRRHGGPTRGRRALRADAFTGKAVRDLGLGQRTLRQAVERGELITYVFGQRNRVKVANFAPGSGPAAGGAGSDSQLAALP
jgi:hypothetical protein